MAMIDMPKTEPWQPATMAPRPSPTASNGSGKRPSRKSTLTQQQKNQKRQRATQDQLITLELEFNNNPTPTSTVRERIAQEINMTERSVQIWFQNRRAKIKLMAKKSIETGEECDAIPESMRQYLALQALESGKGVARNGSHRGSTAGSTNSSRNELLLAAEAPQTGKVDKACVTYYINNDSAGYKIEYPFSSIKNITLDPGDGAPAAQPGQPSPGGLVIELMQPPNFFMDSSGSGGFYQCGDFTEDQQASRVLVHHLGGHPKVLSSQLAKLVSHEAYRSRHGVAPLPAPTPAVAVSAPVSPGLHRPASQPNYLSHPHMAPNPEAAYGQHLHPGRGHKRQRSRSVPVAVDMLALQQHAMPHAFQFSPDAPMTASPHNTFYTPLPLHQPVPNGAATAPNLRIDTSTGYGMDYRTYPLSASTTISPSEYAVSPSLFPTATTATPPVKSAVATAAPDQLQAAFYHASYSLPFLSPRQDANGLVDSAGSPLSGVSPRDPVIADQSPPLLSMDRCPSVELFSFPGEPGSLGDDSMGLAELYSKQSLNFPLPSPEMEPGDDLAMQNMISFEAIEPSASDSKC